MSLEKKSNYGEVCLSVDQCVDNKNMVCLSNMCTCSNPNVNYWNGTYCDAISSYNESCTINAACNPSQNLYCNGTEQYPNKCTCLPYNYWTGSICAAQKLNGIACTSSNQCLSQSGLYCSTTCKCLNNYYWLSALKVCVKKATYGELCTTIPNDDTLNLICGGSGYSICPANTFWNGSYCGISRLV